MSKRNLLVAVLGLGMIVCGCAAAQSIDSPSNTSEAIAPSASVDEVLDVLEAVGRDLKDFTANVSLAEEDAVTAESITRAGRVWYENLGDGNARLRVLFETRQLADSSPRPERLEYLLDNGWLIDRDYRKKIEVRRQVLRPDEKINLLKLGEGPFPLPIGQKKEDVHRLFNVAMLQSQPGDPTDTIHLQLTPNPGTQFERKFSAIDVWVDRITGMPARIQTLDKSQATVRTTDLADIRLNQGVSSADFALPQIDSSDWQRHDERYSD